jgi:hypothetical protein
MSAEISVWFQRTPDYDQTKLAAFKYQPKKGRIPVMGLPENEIRLPDDSTVSVTSCWTPDTNMISIIVFRRGKVIGHAGGCWHLGDPYLGVQVEDVGFLHLYCKRESSQAPTDYLQRP